MTTTKWQERREDYALEPVPAKYRTWRSSSLVGVLFGIPTALFFFAFGGQLVEQYGTWPLIIAMLISTLVLGTGAYILVKVSAKVGLNMDLISSGRGMGYKGAGITSLIYGCSFILFFAVEGNFISAAIHTVFPHVPLWCVEIVLGLIFIPLTWFGVTLINIFMWISSPIYIALLIYWIIHIALLPSTTSFLSYQPTHPASLIAGPFLLQLLAPILAINLPAVAADMGRFIPQGQKSFAYFGLSYFLAGACFIVATLLGAWFTIKIHQTNPGLYFSHMMGIAGVIFVVISQLRINILNAYSGSLAFATCLSRLFNFTPGRHWALVVLVVLATVAMFANAAAHLATAFSFLAIFIAAWMITIISNIMLRPWLMPNTSLEFVIKKGQLRNFNPVGVIPLVSALIIAVPMELGIFGPFWVTMAPFIAAFIAFCLVLTIMKLGSYYKWSL